MELSFCELRSKEVVNLFDGKNLGNVIDLTFDINTTKVTGIIVPCDKSFFNIFKNNNDIFIPFNKICKIGKDIILVELTPINSLENNPEKHKEIHSFNTKNVNTNNLDHGNNIQQDNSFEYNKLKQKKKNNKDNFYNNYLF